MSDKKKPTIVYLPTTAMVAVLVTLESWFFAIYSFLGHKDPLKQIVCTSLSGAATIFLATVGRKAMGGGWPVKCRGVLNLRDQPEARFTGSRQYNSRMRLPRRRTILLSATVILAIVVVGAWCLVPRSRITQENFDRIQEGMTYREVVAILGEGQPYLEGTEKLKDLGIELFSWDSGPNYITVGFEYRRVAVKTNYSATPWETLTWYAKKGAAKIGVKWD